MQPEVSSACYFEAIDLRFRLSFGDIPLVKNAFFALSALVAASSVIPASAQGIDNSFGGMGTQETFDIEEVASLLSGKGLSVAVDESSGQGKALKVIVPDAGRFIVSLRGCEDAVNSRRCPAMVFYVFFEGQDSDPDGLNNMNLQSIFTQTTLSQDIDATVLSRGFLSLGGVSSDNLLANLAYFLDDVSRLAQMHYTNSGVSQGGTVEASLKTPSLNKIAQIGGDSAADALNEATASGFGIRSELPNVAISFSNFVETHFGKELETRKVSETEPTFDLMHFPD